MSKELDFMRQNPMGFLATIDENGKPRVRGFGIMVDEQGRIVFGTSNKRRTFGQLKANPHAEWIGKAKNSNTLRVSGDVIIEENTQVKLNAIESNPVIKNIYAGREDDFEMFYLDNVKYDWFEMNVATH